MSTSFFSQQCYADPIPQSSAYAFIQTPDTLHRSRGDLHVSLLLMSFFQAAVKLVLPVSGKIGLASIVLVSAFVFKLPTDYISLGRSYTDTSADERAYLYSSIESFLDGLD